jgi:hypothetical protein
MVSERAVANLLKLARSRGMCCGPLVAFLRFKGVAVTTLKQLSNEEYSRAMTLLREREEV